ncbi:MAG: redoxin family protein [Chloroflexota bacterium]
MAAVLIFALISLALTVLRQGSPPGEMTPTRPAIIVAPTNPPAAMTFVAPTTAPTPAETRVLAPYPVYGPAVEMRDQVWLNTETPPRLANLRGRVVLLEFWAFDCVPCVPVLSNVRAWNTIYGDQGLTVLGIHYPKIAEEHSYDELAAALIRLNITYPVAQDNDGLTWSAYGQQVWPTLTLIDKRGYIRYQQIGAGGYDAMEAAIQALIAEKD